MVEEIGSGAFASVWRAHHKISSQPVAMKVIEKKDDDNDHQKKKFNHEFQIHSSLSHRNIIDV
jgi:serine/threonine protein kinase